MDGLSGSCFDSTTPPIRRLGLFLYGFNLSCILMCFGQKKKKKGDRSNLVPGPPEVQPFPLFVGNLNQVALL